MKLDPSLLCPLLQELLEHVTRVAGTLDPKWSMTISMYPDVTLNASDGHWIGIDWRTKDGFWTLWRGSLVPNKDLNFHSLDDAVKYVIENATVSPSLPIEDKE